METKCPKCEGIIYLGENPKTLKVDFPHTVVHGACGYRGYTLDGSSFTEVGIVYGEGSI